VPHPDPDDEWLQGCTEEGHPLCGVRRDQAHDGSRRPHQAVHVLVQDNQGRFLLQKRSSGKKISPGLWDTSVGGHVGAGESQEEAVLRELEEELGITWVMPVRLYEYLWVCPIEKEHVTTFHLIWEGDVRYPEEEIQEVRFWSLGEIRETRETFGTTTPIFTLNFLHELDRFLEWKEKREEFPMDPSQTEKNLYEAFVGEAKACLRLLGYAEQADKEELPHLANLFRAISAAERVHALKHLRLLKIVEDTQTNLENSFEREISITENIYPEMIRVAGEEKNRAAQISFSHARDSEEFHAILYKKALDHMMEDREVSYHICGVCGYVIDDDPPETCPVCNAKKEMFFQVS